MSATSSKGGKTVKATAWTIAARQSERLIGIVSMIVLARALSPNDFGLVAMAGSVAALIEVFSSFGFDWALLRNLAPQRDDYDTAWTLRLLGGLCIFAALLMVAYPAAIYFRQSAVTPIIAIMGLNSLITASENIGTTDFRRYMQFDKEFKLRVYSKIVGFIAAVTVAVVFRTYWALVIGMSASRLATTALSYTFHPYRPRFCLRARSELLGFSVWMLIGSAMETLAARFSDIWLGRHLGTKSVGLYAIATEISTMATSEIAAPINRAVFSSYTSLADNIPGLRAAYLRVASLIWAIGLPAAVGIGVCSSEIVQTFLGNKWTGAAGVLTLLAAAGALGIMGANTHYIYWALGKARFVTTLSIINAIAIMALIVALGTYYGLLGVAWSQVAASSLVLVTNFAFLSKTLDLRLSVLFSRTYRVMVASALMGAAVIGVRAVIAAETLAAIVELATLVSIGAVIYMALLWLLWRVAGAPEGPESEVLRILKEFVAATRRAT